MLHYVNVHVQYISKAAEIFRYPVCLFYITCSSHGSGYYAYTCFPISTLRIASHAIPSPPVRPFPTTVE